MPIIEKRVAQNGDDGELYWDGSEWIYNDAHYHRVGRVGSTKTKFSNWQLFRDIPLLKGANILSAKLTWIARYTKSGSPVKSRVRAAAEDNPEPPSSADDYLGRPLTTSLDFDDIPPSTGEEPYDSPDLASIIQELVNRENWQKSNRMLLFWDDRDGRTTLTNKIRDAYTHNEDPAKATLLTIEYEEALPGIETQDATNIKSNQATLATKVLDDLGKTLSVRHNYGKTTAYGMNTPWQDGKHTNDIISQTATNLDPETEYHFRGEAVFED